MIMSTQPPLGLPTVYTKNEARANQSSPGGSKLSIPDRSDPGSITVTQAMSVMSYAFGYVKGVLITHRDYSSIYMADQVHPAPPPHSLSLAGNCDLEIGPHLFPQTKIFFVQYRYRQPSAPTVTPTPVPPPSTPTATQHPPPITVSHELHAKVLAAAAKDPDLHHVLQLASQGLANVTQLRTLGTAIRAIEAGTYTSPTSIPPLSSASSSSLAAIASRSGQPQTSTAAQPRSTSALDSLSALAPVSASASLPRSNPTPTVPPKPTAATAPTPAPPTAPTPAPSTHVQTPPTRAMAPPALPTTAVLLEFAERSIDRWLLPTEYVLIDRRLNGDVHLSTFYPFDAYVPAGGTARSKPAHPITMRFLGASTEVWNALSRTCTVVAPSSVQAVLSEVITNVPQRSYLQYCIAPGALWEDIKTANPHAQSFLLPSKTPIPSTTSRQRRNNSAAGGGVLKKRKTDSGDGTAKPKAKGKEKAEPMSLAILTPAPTNRPAAVSDKPVIPSSNAPTASESQTPTPAVPTVSESIPKVATALVPSSNSTMPLPAPTASTPPLRAFSTTVSRPSPGNYSARIVHSSHSGRPAAYPNNATRSSPPPQHPALSNTTTLSQPQALSQLQQAGQPLNQHISADPPVSGGKSE
ncbi:hypothetical protein RHS04_01960 [Rhizoctonia solani]|uniref:Uncharacterized protein n=1 Tax=Rhizoctonia solani TaxID=456999 RepID=A0A8H7HDN0_9AGAM|nr:hypothetical protein RHS04_01960 [Rhizoctonia solani]